MKTPRNVFERHFGGPTTARAGALMLHGLGEHSGRHIPHLELLAQHGIYCRAFDWPGHGKTDGQRGHIDSMATISQIVKEQMANLRNEIGPDKQVGMLAHSMGGLLALYHLTKHPRIADFAWIGSSLIDPDANASRLKKRLARILNTICPRFPIKSGVLTRQCRSGPEKRRDPLMHRTLTVRLGVTLLAAAREVQSNATQIHPKLRLLMTHGSADRVCPPQYSRALFDRLPIESKTYHLMNAVLHEPFHDDTRAQFHDILESWLQHELLPYLDKPTFTKSAI